MVELDALRDAMKALGTAFLAVNDALDALAAALPEPAPEPDPAPEEPPVDETPPPVDETPPPSDTGESFVSPPLDVNGLAARNGMKFMGHSWGNNSGQTWNREVPYAVGLGTDGKSLRFELRDTPNDHGKNDPDNKRRAEIGTAAEYRNGEVNTLRYRFKASVDNLNTSLGNTINQIHWPSGASPALAHRLVYHDGGPAFRVTARGASEGNEDRGTVPLELDIFHDVEVEFRLGVDGYEITKLNGKVVSEYHGEVGTDKEDGYSLRLGCYGAPLNGMRIVYEYDGLEGLPS